MRADAELSFKIPTHSAIRSSSIAFWSDLFAVLARTQNKVGDFIGEHRLLALPFIEGLPEGEGLVTFASERADGFPVQLKSGGLRAGQGRSQDAVVACDGDVERQMMTAELEHPRTRCRRRTEK